ncbi:MAG TPA: NAD(P)H-dependent oxidoreductase [Enterococcus columbae]|nr:NAD(P)H-dependent oxidoreductase [Enterococcus columbae]
MKTTVFLFHPNLDNESVTNKQIADALKAENIEVRDMYQLYPDFNIDVAVEQEVLTQTDRIVLQFPMYWYSSPALLKQWEDMVLTYGWAYGSQGTALHGKELLIIVTPGAEESKYQRNGEYKYTIQELLRPFQVMSNFVGTTFKKPFVIYGTMSLSEQTRKIEVEKLVQYLKLEELPNEED